MDYVVGMQYSPFLSNRQMKNSLFLRLIWCQAFPYVILRKDVLHFEMCEWTRIIIMTGGKNPDD